MDQDNPSEKPPQAQHEFDSRENKVISDLANAMSWVAVPLLILGVLYIVVTAFCLIQAFQHPGSILAALYVGLIAVLFLALGRWTKQSAVSFHQIVSTSGQDISHLMQALENLRKKYSLLSVIVKIYVAIIVISLIVSLVTMVLGAFKG